ncbi:MAG: diguanylate cyclase [Octadecabacter sp.]|nr:diguanylate cyclase [Octadecabacter sp.]
MTGASNRGAFLDCFNEVVSAHDQAPVGILHIDLDNFKNINDRHGHAAGDAVLIHVTNLLQASVRPIDMVSRVGGDEFVITCPRTPELGFLGDVAAHLVEKLSAPLKWGGSLISCDASIGAAISGESPVAEDLLAQADVALYEAKRAGRHQAAVYDASMQQRHETKIQRSNEFGDALNTAALDCFFQPKLALDTGEIIGVEALVRWNHPKDGIVAPDGFLSIAKELGLMADLDLKSMSCALREKQKLAEAGYENVGVAFNASPELLVHPDFFDRLVWEADNANIDHAQITIEVLETPDFGNLAEGSPQASSIRQLYDAGFQIHLDDFGVGFAGLSHPATF